MFTKKLIIISLALALSTSFSLAQNNKRISNSVFDILYSDEGITSLKRVNDLHDTNYIAADNALGSLIVRYRIINENEWREASEIMPAVEQADNQISYTLGKLMPTLTEKSTVSSSSESGNLRALNDGRIPFAGRFQRRQQTPVFTMQSSNDEPRWVQYNFPEMTEVETSQVYFITGENEDSPQLPKSWRLLYRDGSDWKPVSATSAYELQANRFNAVNFSPVRTGAMRLEVECDGDSRVDIAEWRVGPARNVESIEDLEVNERFKLNGDSFDWTITLANNSEQGIEVGDLAVPMRFSERTPRNRGDIYTQKLLRHSYIAGYGSWIFWHRANVVGPFLVMTTGDSTNFEYFDNSGGAFTPYIHATVASEAPIARARAFGRKQPWRLPLTALLLAPKGQGGDSINYSFKFQFAPDFDGVRDVFYAENLFDTNILPGMALPADLPAMISLRTKVDIDAIEPEFAADTNIEYLGQRGTDNHVYKVNFKKLGENMLTVRYGGKYWMSLEFFVMEPLETVIKKRSRFLVTHMQHSDPNKPWYGAYGDWDQVNKVLRNPEDRDGMRPWLIDSSDDAGNARPAFIAAKNVFFPEQEEIVSLERYVRYYLWNDLKDGKGGMQMTENEKYPYGIYGTFDNWWGHRVSDDPGRNGQAHLWRIYDYPHIIHLYYRMYQIGKFYPEMVKYKNAGEYLELAYRTAKAYWEVPKQIEGWSANSVGTMNEAFLPELIEALAKEGKQEWSDTIRAYWESKVARFVLQTPNLYGSEFSFDSTGFESTQAFAGYAVNNVEINRVKPPTTDYGIRRQTPAKFSDITPEAAKEFQEFQMRLNVGDRGWLETTYYQLGTDYRGSTSYLLSYMSHLGGWGVLDHGLYFAENPTNYLRLGYASSLSAWSLVNSGTAESGYGDWYPDKENDGATGGGFVPEAWGRGWIGKQMPRGAWYYSAEEDVGYVGALRTHATILTYDPLFGHYVYGGILERKKDAVEVISRDGLRTRFHVIRNEQRFHMILDRDGYSQAQPITVSDDLGRIDFTLENRSGHAHNSGLKLAGLPEGDYRVLLDERTIASINGGATEQLIILPVGDDAASRISIMRTNRTAENR
ncbi:MAG: hypothetical protein JW715_12065 [Sedimentisphaerales bacterium]|nr:hypothetical protein [Sedimentisphaerales bacterium]